MIKVMNTSGSDIRINERLFKVHACEEFSQKDAEDLLKIGCSYEIEHEKDEEKEEIEE